MLHVDPCRHQKDLQIDNDGCFEQCGKADSIRL